MALRRPDRWMGALRMARHTRTARRSGDPGGVIRGLARDEDTAVGIRMGGQRSLPGHPAREWRRAAAGLGPPEAGRPHFGAGVTTTADERSPTAGLPGTQPG
jgi:hypothetical protein